MQSLSARRLSGRLSAIAAIALAAAACGGDESESTATTAPSVATTEATTPPTTIAPTTTAVAATVAPSTTVAEEVLRMPLTGEPIDSADQIPDRPALVVKMPVNPEAMPHVGLNDADIIFQTIINDSYTRYLTVFQSADADPVGPVRSGRLQDVDIMAAFSEPLYAWSGGNNGVTRGMNQADADGLIVDLSASSNGGLYFRSDRASAPHNLMSSTEALWAAAPDDYRIPTSVFPYLAPDSAPDGESADEINVTLDSIDSRWEYDAESGRYLHFHEGKEHQTEADGQVWADNVVVMMMDYGRSPADGNNPMMSSLGSNSVYVFSGGTVRQGVWVRSENTDGWQLYDNLTDLNPIGLVPGRTWVEMPRNTEGNVTFSADGGEPVTPTTVSKSTDG